GKHWKIARIFLGFSLVTNWNFRSELGFFFPIFFSIYVEGRLSHIFMVRFSCILLYNPLFSTSSLPFCFIGFPIYRLYLLNISFLVRASIILPGCSENFLFILLSFFFFLCFLIGVFHHVQHCWSRLTARGNGVLRFG